MKLTTNKKGEFIKLLMNVVIIGVISAILLSAIIAFKNNNEEQWKYEHMCENFRLQRGFCVAKNVDCDDYYATSGKLLNLSCPTAEKPTCCLPKDDPVDHMYLEWTWDVQLEPDLVRDTISLSGAESLSGVHFYAKGIPEYYYNVTKIEFDMSSDQDCVDSDISISCNYDEAEKEYQKFPGTSGCTNSGLNIKLNKGSCKAKLTIIEELDGEELSHSKTFEFEVI